MNDEVFGFSFAANEVLTSTSKVDSCRLLRFSVAIFHLSSDSGCRRHKVDPN